MELLIKNNILCKNLKKTVNLATFLLVNILRPNIQYLCNNKFLASEIKCSCNRERLYHYYKKYFSFHKYLCKDAFMAIEQNHFNCFKYFVVNNKVDVYRMGGNLFYINIKYLKYFIKYFSNDDFEELINNAIGYKFSYWNLLYNSYKAQYNVDIFRNHEKIQELGDLAADDDTYNFLEMLCENGCILDSNIQEKIIKNCESNCFDYLLTNHKSQLSENTLRLALKYSNWEFLKLLIQNKCPGWDKIDVILVLDQMIMYGN